MQVIKNILDRFKKQTGLNVVSLFDGIACGYEAIERAGLKINSYKAFEIDKYAIKIALKNHPEIIELGNVVNADFNYSKGAPSDYLKRGRRQHVYDIIKSYIVPFDKTLQILDKEVQTGKIGYFGVDSQSRRVYAIHGKSVTLCGDAGGGGVKMGQYLFGCLTPDKINKRQNGQRFNNGTKFYTLTAQDRHGVLVEGYIRKLTPVECERLQTLPDGYTEGISNNRRYKALGNGWTVDVITHILKGIKENG